MKIWYILRCRSDKKVLQVWLQQNFAQICHRRPHFAPKQVSLIWLLRNICANLSCVECMKSAFSNKGNISLIALTLIHSEINFKWNYWNNESLRFIPSLNKNGPQIFPPIIIGFKSLSFSWTTLRGKHCQQAPHCRNGSCRYVRA